MSKSSTASNSKLPPQLPTKSAWARGPPPVATSRSQSPAPSTPTTPNTPGPAVHGNHSRRPSTLGQGASVKEGVSIPRNAPVAAKAGGSGVTFGSIDNAGAPISSSPAAAPAVKSGDVTKFGSVSVNGEAAKSVITNRPQAPSASSSTAPSTASTPATTAPTSTPSPAPKLNKRDISKLFQGPSVAAPPHASTPSPAESTASPASRPSNLPHANAPAFVPPPFTPGGLRTGQNGTPPGGPPRSPSYTRPMANGQNGNVPGRPPSGPNAGVPQAMPSPRMGQHPPPGQPAGMPPMGPWGPYYAYPYGMPPPPPGGEGMYQYPQPPSWGMPPQGMPQHHQQQPGGPPQGMPMSPHKPPSGLQTPSTPTLAHASPVAQHPPPQQSNLTSPPPTPSTSNNSRLNGAAGAFVPKKTISLKSSDGKPVDLDSLRRNVGPSPVSATPQSPSVDKIQHTRTPSRPVVRMETPEQKKAREAAEEEKAKKEREAKEKEEKAKKEAVEKKEREEREKKEREEREKKEAEEKVAREKEEAERKAKEEAEALEKAKKEEEERKRREEEEELAAKVKAEEEAKAKEAEEKKAAEEAAAAKAKAEEEAKAKAAAEPAPAPTPAAEPEKEEGEIVEEKKAADDKPAPLRVETALPSPETRRRPGPLNLKDVGKNIPQPLPSALATARIIDDISSIAYPEGILSPKIELNVNASKGKFKYDRDFLLQFMAVCKDKPDNLPPLDAIGLEPSDQTFGMTRGGSGRRASGMQTPSRSNNPIGLGFGPIGKAGMGNFAMPTGAASKLSSEERFAMASRSASTSGAGMPRAGAPPLSRTSSQGGPGGGDRRRTRSSRGHARDNNRQSTIQQPPANMQPPLEPVAPLEATANRWTPASMKRGATVDMDSPEVVDRKVKALLNKLTMERFDSISDQIIEWANKSEKEKDGRTLIQVIKLVFEKATDEATFSEMYARLCRKMMEQISTKVQDDGILNNEGKPFAGGQLFRKYLLNRCQEDFERGWAAKDAAAAAAAAKATEDAAVKEAASKAKESGKADDGEEFELYSDEYYAAAKAKRRGLGLIRFIGELFKLQMLTERIMHECIKKLLGNVENPEEEEIESLCKLLSTVGSIIDTPKARAHMDVYFSRMKELAKSKNVNSRMTFMLQDVIELRNNAWQPRNKVAAPTTLSHVHEQAAKDRAAADNHAAMNRSNPMQRGGSRRGDNRNEGPVIGPDGWAIAGSGSGAPRAPPKAGDLSNFGKINKQQPMTFGPSGVFAKGKKDGAPGSVREVSVSRTASTRNMFDMLSGTDAPEPPAATKSSRPPSRKPSVDLSQGGASDAPMQRRKLNLLPRSKPVEEAAKPEDEGDEEDEEGDEEQAGPSMSEEEAKRKIDEDIKELFSIQSLDEAESYFTTLPAEYRWQLVDKMCNKGIDGKASETQLVTDLLTRAHDKSLADIEAFEKGLEPLAEFIDDIAIDVPKAFDIFAGWMRATGIAADEERRTRIAEKLPEGKDKLLGMLA